MSIIDQALQEARDASRDPLRAAALARAVSAVAALTQGQDDASLGAAVAASSNVEVLYRMISAPEAVDILRADDPLIDIRPYTHLVRSVLIGQHGASDHPRPRARFDVERRHAPVAHVGDPTLPAQRPSATRNAGG